MKARIIRTDGTEETYDVANGPGAMRTIEQLIGAELVDVVNLRDGRVMIVDDAGWNYEVVKEGKIERHVPTSPRRPINDRATALYLSVCAPGTTHQIAGDVAIALDKDFA